MTGMERIVGRLAAWMTALVIVAVSLLGYATKLAWDAANAGRQDAVAASGRLDTALSLLRDADVKAEDLLEGQRTLAEQLEAAGIVPAVEVPPRRPARRNARPTPDRPTTTTTSTRPPDSTTSTTTSTTTTAPRPPTTTRPTTTTTRCLVLDLGCDLTLPGGSGR